MHKKYTLLYLHVYCKREQITKLYQVSCHPICILKSRFYI